jgi:hypothetical protein
VSVVGDDLRVDVAAGDGMRCKSDFLRRYVFIYEKPSAMFTARSDFKLATDYPLQQEPRVPRRLYHKLYPIR